MPDEELIVRVREMREARGWSQQDLADRSGLSRAGISAIETGRVAPSTAAALSLASALGRRVEDLFILTGRTESREAAWAWPPAAGAARFWEALVGGRLLRYPVEPNCGGALPHDGVWRGGRVKAPDGGDPERTLVLAGCDPAAGLLVSEAARQENLRVIALTRSSTAALTILGSDLVHVAGVHLSSVDEDGGNATAVRACLGAGYRLLRVTRWEEGVALDHHRKLRSVGALAGARLRWIGRDVGSGASQCLETILGRRRAPLHVARDHRGVADAIRSGYADAGVCLRFVSEEAGLPFLTVRSEPYDLCFPEETRSDWRLEALVRVVRSPRYRSLLRDLPGYDPRGSGELRSVR